MRIIKYKSAESSDFRNYIDIGCCERDYYFINFFLEGEHETESGKLYYASYEDWFKNFERESIGSRMIIVNYFLSEYMGWSSNKNSPQLNYFKSLYGDKTSSVISNNLNHLLKFNGKWFYDQTSLFNGLDLNHDDIDERIEFTSENEEGVISEVEFDDGSKIIFNDSDDNLKSFFVDEDDYAELKSEMEIITSLFKP
jgi:hypothetical protein